LFEFMFKWLLLMSAVKFFYIQCRLVHEWIIFCLYVHYHTCLYSGPTFFMTCRSHSQDSGMQYVLVVILPGFQMGRDIKAS
jgi:hypothetical protein